MSRKRIKIRGEHVLTPAAPIPLLVAESAISQIGNYGDIVKFPEVDPDRFPFLKENQQYILTRP